MACVTTTASREEWRPGVRLPRHRHAHAYVALVLNGGYAEAGDRGRLNLTAGTAAFHAPFEAHHNQFGPHGAQILNLRLPGWLSWPKPLARVLDPDRVARIAETDPPEAFACLTEMLAPHSSAPGHWVDELAAAILADPCMRLDAWARSRGVAAETASRAFSRTFGVSARRFRAEIRAQRALQRVLIGKQPLAEVASDTGFADQAHMSRGIRLLTGRSPGAWR
jgi:AraC-like DNA-binding protein